MLKRFRDHFLVQRCICDPCDGRHNTGDVVMQLADLQEEDPTRTFC